MWVFVTFFSYKWLKKFFKEFNNRTLGDFEIKSNLASFIKDFFLVDALSKVYVAKTKSQQNKRNFE